MLVSLSDRDFTDSFGQAGAMGKYLSGQSSMARSPETGRLGERMLGWDPDTYGPLEHPQGLRGRSAA